MNRMKGISDLLESKRIELGLSYHEIGKELEVASSTVQRWFTNTSKMNVCHVNRICKLLRITPNELVDWDAASNSEIESLVLSIANSEFENIPNIDDFVTKEELEEFKANIEALTSEATQFEQKVYAKQKLKWEHALEDTYSDLSKCGR